MQTLWQDLRYGVRMLLKKPGFTLIAVITLGLGIGANAAIFSVVNTVLLKPLPFKEPDRLTMILETRLPQFPEFSVAAGNFLDWKKQNTVFERLVAIGSQNVNLIGTGDPERLSGMNVTDGFFAALGVQPQLGRAFLPEEDQAERNNVVILSHGLWQRRFGSNSAILNQSINLNGVSHTVVGVMPADFRFIDNEVEFWKPMGFTAQQAQEHGGHTVAAFGQLKPGVTIEQANTEMKAIAERLAAQYPESNNGWSVKLLPLLEFTVRDIKPALIVLLIAVAFVLLIACVNVSNLLLVRATGRQKEVAIRTALGASRWRVVRQLLTESFLLALAGGVLGLLLARWGMDLLLKLAPQNLPRVSDVSLDNRVLLFTLAITSLTGLIFGLVPALQASKPNLSETMKDAGRGMTEGGRRQLVRSTLVVLEVASALVLLVGAGLMIKSFWHLQKVDPGFNPDKAIAATVSLPKTKYPNETQQVAFFQQLLERVKNLPGVETVGTTSFLPMSNEDMVLAFEAEGQPPPPPDTIQSTNYYSVSPDYFKAMGIRLLRGRGFDEHDTKDSKKVAVVNETLAKKVFPNQDPIGKRITFDSGVKNPAWFEIVGIVGDVKHYGLNQATTLQTYEPYTQQPFSYMTLVTRTSGDPATLTSAIRNAVLELDKEQPVYNIRTLESFISTSIARQRFSMLLLVVFAALAMGLAAVGIYGVLSYTVSQRTPEIGIRMALGAQTSDVLKLVVGHGMLLTLIGVGAGLIASLILTRLMSDLLFNVSPTDPLTFILIALLLITTAMLACFIPARRATKVDPLVALRYE